MRIFVDADACPVVRIVERHLAKTARKGSSKNHLKGSHKRTTKDDQRFAEGFGKLKDLLAKRDEMQKKELLKAVENNSISYEEITTFLKAE